MSVERVILYGLVIVYFGSSTSQSSFFLAKKYGNYNYICITNSSSGLSWIQEDIIEKLDYVSTYTPKPKPEQTWSKINCNITNDNKTKRYFVKYPWQLMSSLQSDINQPVLDARWEEMEVVKTEFVEPQYVKLKYTLIQNMVVKDDNFEIPFSIRIRQDGHIFLCDGEYPPEARCYWFMLQAFNGNGSVIRKCEKNFINSEHGFWPKAPCNERRVYINHAGWTQIKLISENAHYPNGYKLLVSTIGTNQNAYWAIDKVRSCQRQEFRMIGLSEEVPCQLISDQEQVAKYMPYSNINSNTNCPEDTIGDFCVKCDWIFENCKRITICNEHQCSCSAGYRDHYSNYYGSTTCYSGCSENTYGHGCQKQCAKCKQWNCNKIDGTCSQGGCNENYSGPKCDIPPATIFANPPEITEISYTEATVKVSNFELESSGPYQIPQNYTIQYKKAEAPNSNWTDTDNHLYQFNMSTTFKLSNLDPETQYYVRSVTIDINGQWQLGDHLNFSNFTTFCKEISDNDIHISVSNTTARIWLSVVTPITCKSYLITLFETPQSGVSNSSGTVFTDLLPYKNYTVKISGKNKTHEKRFTTDEGVPTCVLGLTAIATTATSVNLRWTEPVNINGVFKHFVLKYQIISYTGCNGTSAHSSTKSEKIKGTSVTITDLIPYSLYEFTVFTVNTKFGGRPTSQKIATLSSEKIQTEEIPNIIKMNTTHMSASIELSKIKCEKIRGPLMVEVTTKCTSEWCQSQHRNSRTEKKRFPNMTIVQVDNLESFSDYDLEVKFCRDHGSCNEPQRRKFKTGTTVPRKVTNLLAYSKNTSSISLRWKPPYPPTGILEEYHIVYSYYHRQNITKEIVTQITPCRLWPKLHCASLSDLPNEAYITVKIYAKNKHVIEFGESTEIRTSTKIGKSSHPYNFKIKWTSQNDLQMEWKHPNETNGDVSYFEVELDPYSQPDQKTPIKHKLNVSTETYNLTYYYVVNGSSLLPTQPYAITVYAFNGIFGDAISQIITSPPDVPTLSKDADLISLNDSLRISVSPQKVRGSTDTYRLLVLRSDQQSNLKLYPNLKQYDLNKDLKVVVECDLSQIIHTFEISIGSSQQNPICTDVDNNPLQPATTYNVRVVLLNVFRNESRANIYCYNITTKEDSLSANISSILYGLFVLLIVIPLLVFFIMKWHRKKNVGSLHTSSTSDNTNDCQPNTILLNEPKHSKQKNNLPENIKNLYGAPTVYTKIINRKDFENYAKTSFGSQELKRQHEAILKTISTYETVRDILRLEYIDMNYTSGLKIKKPYVATKIPNGDEYDEFWKTIWLENISHIILFEDIHTNDRTCVEPYWPKQNSNLCYEDVTVECTTCEDHHSFQRRKFTIKFNNKSRQVEQLHFSLKSDDKFYLSSLNYVHFFQKMTKIPHSSKSPILVHSSSGMRGTSFALLCDISLRTAIKDGAIDVMANLQNLTQCTPEMMIDYDHYVAAHAVIVDILRHVDTTINCSFFDVNKLELFKKDEIQKHFQYLHDTVWLDRINIESDEERYMYNRYISPGSKRLVTLPSEDINSSFKQFNIIIAKGFKAPKIFLVVQEPKPNQLSDFLNLVQDQKVSVIVTLNENIFSWPCKNDPMMEINTNVKLEHQVTRNLKTYDWITVKLTTQSATQTVEIISFKNWFAPTMSLPNVQNFTNFVSESNEIFKNVETVLITDCGNVTTSGLYIATTYIIQKIKTESICDVCTSVRILRRHSENFVIDNNQYMFLLEAAQNYLKEFSLYEVR